MIETMRRLALPIAIVSLSVNLVMFVLSTALWALAWYENWLGSVVFVAHVSMLALVFSAVSGTAAGLAGILALMPTDTL
jgi:hypothetical protein